MDAPCNCRAFTPRERRATRPAAPPTDGRVAVYLTRAELLAARQAFRACAYLTFVPAIPADALASAADMVNAALGGAA
jgi:hypothetical protein